MRVDAVNSWLSPVSFSHVWAANSVASDPSEKSSVSRVKTLQTPPYQQDTVAPASFLHVIQKARFVKSTLTSCQIEELNTLIHAQRSRTDYLTDFPGLLKV